jgi:hypothetical protein
MRQTDPRTYRLELADDELGEARTIEFNAHGAYSALQLEGDIAPAVLAPCSRMVDGSQKSDA